MKIHLRRAWIACGWSIATVGFALAAESPGRSTGPAPDRVKAPVTVSNVSWQDAARGRVVPATIYSPALEGKFPVIVFSPGLGRSREPYGYLGQCWAQYGYVAVLVEHTDSNDAIWKGKVRPMKHLRDVMSDPSTHFQRARDLSFAINQLEELARQKSSLALRMDLERIGAAGNDLGAEAALALAGQLLPGGARAADARVKAIVAMSTPVPLGQVPLEAAYREIRIPCLHLTGTQDDGRVGATKAPQRRLPFDMIRDCDQILVTFAGGDHMMFSGHQRARNGQNDGHYQHLACVASTVFWDAYLSDMPKARAWLASRGLEGALGGSARVERKLAAPSKLARDP